MSTPQTSPNLQPTKRVYLDEHGVQMTFNWTRPMPQGGYLGEVTFGSYQKKPIQVFDAKLDNTDGSKTWQYQAQDGAFLCSMKVSSDRNSITFFARKKGDWPLIVVSARFPLQPE